MSDQLNAFEQRLLGELQSLNSAARKARRPRRSTTRRRALVAAAATVLAAAGAVVGSTVKAQPAWAVDVDAGGPVRVTINRPEGASALRQRLADAGITADVQFPAEGQRCSPDRFRGSEWVGDTPGLLQGTISRSRVEFTLDPAKVAPGTTLTIEVAHSNQVADAGSDALLATIGTVRGAVPACRPVSLTGADFTGAGHP